MVKLMSSIVTRAHELLDNYSYARRYGLRLPVQVALLYFKSAAVCVPCSPAMSGYLRDISKTGLSLVVPSLRFGNRFLVSEYHPLGVRVELPNGAVNIQVSPVRYDKLSEGQGERRYLIGGRILCLPEADRKRLLQPLQLTKKGHEVSFNLTRDAKSA